MTVNVTKEQISEAIMIAMVPVLTDYKQVTQLQEAIRKIICRLESTNG